MNTFTAQNLFLALGLMGLSQQGHAIYQEAMGEQPVGDGGVLPTQTADTGKKNPRIDISLPDDGKVFTQDKGRGYYKASDPLPKGSSQEIRVLFSTPFDYSPARLLEEIEKGLESRVNAQQCKALLGSNDCKNSDGTRMTLLEAIEASCNQKGGVLIGQDLDGPEVHLGENTSPPTGDAFQPGGKWFWKKPDGALSGAGVGLLCTNL
jgi:hypothetical protein